MPLQDKYQRCPEQLAQIGPLALALVGREAEAQQAWAVLRKEMNKGSAGQGGGAGWRQAEALSG
jgi:hypothetical protein